MDSKRLLDLQRTLPSGREPRLLECSDAANNDGQRS